MVKCRRSIQQWDRWLMQPLGKRLLAEEEQFLSSLLTKYHGKHALLIGVPQQLMLLTTSAISQTFLVSPLIHKSSHVHCIEGEFKDLPIASASVDLVILPHTLEYLDNPRHVLTEACRVVKPEGHIIVLGFNIYSLWGIKKKFTQQKHTPWSTHFISAAKIKKWLTLADFQMVKQSTCFFRPPFSHHDHWYENMKWMEWVGSKCWPCWGGAYVLMAKAKVIPLTPIKLHWQQELSGASVSIPGSSVRNLS